MLIGVSEYVICVCLNGGCVPVFVFVWFADYLCSCVCMYVCVFLHGCLCVLLVCIFYACLHPV